MSHRIIIVRYDSQTLSWGCNPSFIVLFSGPHAFTSALVFPLRPGVTGWEKKKKIEKLPLFCQIGLRSHTWLSQDKKAAFFRPSVKVIRFLFDVQQVRGRSASWSVAVVVTFIDLEAPHYLCSHNHTVVEQVFKCFASVKVEIPQCQILHYK